MNSGKRVLVYADQRKGAVREFLAELETWLSENSIEIETVWSDDTRDLSHVSADVLVVLGGDGSILAAARRLAPRGIPTIGVNLGRLGFLAAMTRTDYRAVLGQVLEGRFEVQERAMLAYQVIRAGQVVEAGTALNDVNLSRTSRGGLITIELLIESRVIASYRSDGLLFSTPTGSTAYSLSAGGPVLDPDLEAFTVTPICPHQLTHRPLVIPGNRNVVLRLAEGLQATISIDGQRWLELGEKDEVHLACAEHKFRWIVVNGRDFYGQLRSCMGWGGAEGAREIEP